MHVGLQHVRPGAFLAQAREVHDRVHTRHGPVHHVGVGDRPDENLVGPALRSGEVEGTDPEPPGPQPGDEFTAEPAGGTGHEQEGVFGHALVLAWPGG